MGSPDDRFGDALARMPVPRAMQDCDPLRASALLLAKRRALTPAGQMSPKHPSSLLHLELADGCGDPDSARWTGARGTAQGAQTGWRQRAPFRARSTSLRTRQPAR